jgi:hypothetical protein
VYKNLEEGTDAWDMELTSDQDSGYIHKEDFVNQENVEHIQELLTKLLTHHWFCSTNCNVNKFRSLGLI